MNLMTAIQNTVSISLFNRGLAGKIFQEVNTTGAKVVMKNNAPECVLLSPQEYVDLMETVQDARLLLTANERMRNYDSDKTIPAEEVQQDFGITDAQLAGFDEVEFE
ncbi:MAG: type II toxin-antitoxin system Phd/YefM family antitoxin [Ruminococcus sp.]|nr:type II toxin-antitoxin system Phd/YefM family antitoxin [Ruminococcus sp.]